MVVDDDVYARTALVELLRQEGYDVAAAPDASRAVGRFSSFTPDLVLTDLMMPDMDGIELTKRLRAAPDPVAVVVMTASEAVSSAIDAMRAGASDYLTKPIHYDELLLVIDRVFESLRMRREAIAAEDERRQAREAEHFLLGAAMTLSASLETADVVRAVARVGVPRLGELCFVDVVTTNDQPQRVAWAHADLAAQRDLDRALGASDRSSLVPSLVAEVIATGRSMRLPTVAHLPIARRLAMNEALIVPLTLGTRQLGALTFCTTGDGHYGDREVALAEELARRSALAIEHARLYEQARRALALRDETLAIVSHDLRAPLQTIVLASSLLREDETRAGRWTKGHTVERIEQAAERMDRMIGDLIDIASIDAGQLSVVKRPHGVAAIIEESTASFEAVANARGVKLTVEPPPEMAHISGDRDRVLQVISNLLGNALKVTTAGDAVCLRAKVREREVVFSVSDTGPGIALSEQQRLFERYWRSPTASYRGTGLGLAIAQGIVAAHRGRIWVDSELGRGATFHFTLPLAEPLTTVAARSDRVPEQRY